MNWPWVSRFALDLVSAERDRLLEEKGKLLDHIVRMERREHGLPEVPRPPRPPVEPPPKTVTDYISGFASPMIRRSMLNQCLIQHAREGRSWADIERDLKAEEPDGATPT